MQEVTTKIREIVVEQAGLGSETSTLEDETNLYEAGMTSHASIGVMLALEDTFDIQFPDSLLGRQVFESIAAMREAVLQLKG